jgi:putative transposase
MTFIDEHSDRFAVALLLRVLNIASSTYYAWKKQAEQPCDRDLVDLGLLSNIYEIWEVSGFTYGADRVHGQLSRDGIRVGRKRVERLMAAQAGRERSCAAAGAAAQRSRTRGTHRHRTW